MEEVSLCLKEFSNHVQTSWKDGQVDENFCDVTIACGEKYIEAHKFIVSAGSPVLKNILKNIKNDKPYIYFKGVKYRNLQNIVTFIYQGEVNVPEEDLASFLEVATDLKVKGLSKSVNSEQQSALQKSFAKISSNKTRGYLDIDIDDEISRAESNKLVSELKHYNEDDNDVGKYIDLDLREDDSYHYNATKIQAVSNGMGYYAKYTCHKCDKNYSSNRNLNRHILGEHDNIRYTCDHCTYASKDLSTLKRHKNTRHKLISNISSNKQSDIGKDIFDERQMNESNEPMFKLKPDGEIDDVLDDNIVYLNKKERSQQGISESPRKRCDDDPQVSQNPPIKMISRNKSLPNDLPLEFYHLQSDSSLQNNFYTDMISDFNNSISKPEDMRESNIHKNSLYSCVKCGKQYTSNRNLDRHILGAHDGVRYLCAHCPYKAKDESSVRKHEKSLHGNFRYSCEKCNYTSSTKYQLKLHVEINHQCIRYSCKYCNFQDTTKNNITKHISNMHS